MILAGLLSLRNGGEPRQALAEQLRSYLPKLVPIAAMGELPLTPEVKAKFIEKIKADPHGFFGRKVREMVRTDGLKLILDDGSWVCYRLSGTEPVVRVYSEARAQQDTDVLGKAAKDWVLQ